MPNRLTASAATGAALCLLGLPLRAQAPAGLTAEQGWAAVGQCAALSTERARHDCLDALLRKAGLLTKQAEVAQQRRQFGIDTNSPARVEKAPPAPAPARAAAPTPSDTERMELELASAVAANDGKVVLKTSDGAVWKQTDSTTIPRLPHAGEQVRIRKASLGSYLCELPTHHTFRCVRTQ